MDQIKINNIIRVSKRTARAMYEENCTVEIIPHLMNPCGLWMQGYAINKLKEEGRDFDHIVNEYEYYNCNNETGRYAAYYIDEGDLLRYRSYNKNNRSIKR